MCRAKA